MKWFCPRLRRLNYAASKYLDVVRLKVAYLIEIPLDCNILKTDRTDMSPP